MKGTKRYFAKVLFIILYKGVLGLNHAETPKATEYKYIMRIL